MPKTGDLTKRLKKIKLLLLDVDGTMSDKGIFIGDREDIKRFDVRDGAAVFYARWMGLRVAMVSGRASKAVTRRATELEIKDVYQDSLDKVPVLEKLLVKYKLHPKEVLHMGDDLTDLPIFKRVGVGVAVADAVPEVKKRAHYVTRLPGGHGAVREVVEMVLKAQRTWSKLLERYLE
ncbi:MAG: HAD hydrolase family protein [bacterium]